MDFQIKKEIKVSKTNVDIKTLEMRFLNHYQRIQHQNLLQHCTIACTDEKMRRNVLLEISLQSKLLFHQYRRQRICAANEINMSS